MATLYHLTPLPLSRFRSSTDNKIGRLAFMLSKAQDRGARRKSNGPAETRSGSTKETSATNVRARVIEDSFGVAISGGSETRLFPGEQLELQRGNSLHTDNPSQTGGALCPPKRQIPRPISLRALLSRTHDRRPRPVQASPRMRIPARTRLTMVPDDTSARR